MDSGHYDFDADDDGYGDSDVDIVMLCVEQRPTEEIEHLQYSVPASPQQSNGTPKQTSRKTRTTHGASIGGCTRGGGPMKEHV